MYNFQILQRFFLSSDCQFGKISYSHYQALAQNREACAPIGIQGQALLERYTYTLHVLSGVFVSVKKKKVSVLPFSCSNPFFLMFNANVVDSYLS